MRVGFIGLGSMGGGMALRIARTGFPLSVYDINSATMAAFDEPGVECAADSLEVARFAEVLAVCVRTDADLKELAGDGELFDALGKGGVFIVHSTVAPDLCRELAVVAAERGVSLIDAGVSGGGPAALRGEQSIYAGGDPEAFERVKPLFECLAKSLVYLGPVGRGMEGKLLNNLISIANYGMSAAILDLGEKLNFDREELKQALLAGSAESFALRVVSGFLNPERAPALRQLLEKDLDHARLLAGMDDPAMAALVPAAESMLARLDRASS
jgi:3-hydroxyisobutyrate dehydrogenase-like beta-hydroxyacid dehydrogenase